MTRKTDYGNFIGNIKISTIEENGKLVPIIYGDPEGLESLGKVIIAISKANLNELRLPDGAREHIHISPNNQLSKDSLHTIIGRLDAKGSGEFPSNFENTKRDNKNEVFNFSIHAKPKVNTSEFEQYEGASFTCLVDEDYYQDAELKAINSFANGNWEYVRITSWFIHDEQYIYQEKDYEEDKGNFKSIFHEALKNGLSKDVDYLYEIDVDEDL